MRFITTYTFRTFLLAPALTSALFAAACLEEPGGTDPSESSAACGPGDVSVVASLVHDARGASPLDSALVNLNDGANPEAPSGCDATLALVVGGIRTELQETRLGQFEAGYSEIVPNLPPLTLVPGIEHRLEIDLGSDGSVDVTGTVTLSDVQDFRVVRATGSEVVFDWSDAGAIGDTMYYVQASDERDFAFPDNFATGYVEADTTIAFGGASEWAYFTANGPLFARIQAETVGTLSVAGRFTAWEWPFEPILQY